MPMITPTASSNVAEMVPVRVLTCGTPDANLWPNGLPCANEAPCANGAPCAYGAVLSSSTAVPGLAGPWPWPADRSASGAVATAAGASTRAIGGVRRRAGGVGAGGSLGERGGSYGRRGVDVGNRGCPAADRGDRARCLYGGELRPGGGPAFGGFRPPLQRMRTRAAHGPDPVEVTPAPDLVRGSPVRDGHLVKHDPNLPAPA